MINAFALKWACCWLAAFAAFSFVGMAIRIPLPAMPWPFLLGAAAGAVITGPIVWSALGPRQELASQDGENGDAK